MIGNRLKKTGLIFAIAKNRKRLKAGFARYAADYITFNRMKAQKWKS